MLDKGFVRLVDSMPSDPNSEGLGDAAITQAARVSYGKGTKTLREDRSLIRYLMRHGHLSPFEMCSFKFHIKLPIFVARQMVRHRTCKMNEISARYSVLEEDCYVPTLDRLQTQSKTNKQGSGKELKPEDKLYVENKILTEQSNIFNNYHEYLDIGLSRELARINLPVSTYTSWFWKMDLRNLFHFIHLRTDPHAQKEIQDYASAIYELIKPIVPLACEAFDDYVVNARTFSKQEMEIIRKLNPEKLQYVIEESVLSSREKLEFQQKLVDVS